MFAMKWTVALIIGMNSNAGIAEHRLWSCRRNNDLLRTIFDRISDMVEFAFHLFFGCFQIGKSGLILGTPIDHIGATVDQPFLIKANKDLSHGARKPFIECETLSRPVTTGALAADLALNCPAGMLFPGPH